MYGTVLVPAHIHRRMHVCMHVWKSFAFVGWLYTCIGICRYIHTGKDSECIGLPKDWKDGSWTDLFDVVEHMTALSILKKQIERTMHDIGLRSVGFALWLTKEINNGRPLYWFGPPPLKFSSLSASLFINWINGAAKLWHRVIIVLLGRVREKAVTIALLSC